MSVRRLASRIGKVAFSRAGGIGLMAGIFVSLGLNAGDGVGEFPEGRPEVPEPREVYVLEELREWVLAVSSGTRGGWFSEPTLTAAIQRRPASFELFRGLNEETTQRELVRKLPYGDLIWRAAQRHDVDALLLAAVVEAESGFNPEAISPQGAMGLMQIMPATAETYSVAEPFDPATNVDLGARYLAWLSQEFDGDLSMVLAGYNAGPGNVNRFGGVPPFRETRVYVNRVLTRYVSHHQDLWERSGAEALTF